MRVGVLSDIHSNIIGLDAVLKAMNGVDMIVNCGDLTGFHKGINESIDRFKDIPIETLSVLGNHDSYLLRGVPPDKDVKIKVSAEYCKRKISPDNMRFLRSLDPSLSIALDGRTFLLCHGSPWDLLEEYIYPDSKRFPDFQELREEIIIMGHTHYPFVKKVSGKIILNPGSVGQPRGTNKKATFATLDTENMTVGIQEVDCFSPEIWREITIGGNAIGRMAEK